MTKRSTEASIQSGTSRAYDDVNNVFPEILPQYDGVGKYSLVYFISQMQKTLVSEACFSLIYLYHKFTVRKNKIFISDWKRSDLLTALNPLGESHEGNK
jgi:hypothetical protein